MPEQPTQILDTVDWAGDGDDHDFFCAIERVFDLRLRHELPWTTFGEVRDHVVRHLGARGGRGETCATQMTFYRLRRGLDLGRNIGPGAPLPPPILVDPKRRFADLEADTDLRMPSTRIGWAGVVSMASFLGAGSVLAFTVLPAPLDIFAAVVLGCLGLWLRHIDRRRLPRGCATLGDLARMAAEQNRGRLARDGARLTDAEVWQIIQELAVEESRADPNSIGLQTTFFRNKVQVA
jgi:hypothetical protein